MGLKETARAEELKIYDFIELYQGIYCEII
jgi:hypothetical protein